MADSAAEEEEEKVASICGHQMNTFSSEEGH
jgi:hypothetical protein